MSFMEPNPNREVESGKTGDPGGEFKLPAENQKCFRCGKAGMWKSGGQFIDGHHFHPECGYQYVIDQMAAEKATLERTLEESQASLKEARSLLKPLQQQVGEGVTIYRQQVEQLQSELSALKGENERLKEALRLFLRNRQWMIDVGATEGPLPQSLIENFAELQSEAVAAAELCLRIG